MPNVWHQRRAQRVRCMPGLGPAVGVDAGAESAGQKREIEDEEPDRQGEEKVGPDQEGRYAEAEARRAVRERLTVDVDGLGPQRGKKQANSCYWQVDEGYEAGEPVRRPGRVVRLGYGHPIQEVEAKRH